MSPDPILRTKLHRPARGPDGIVRQRLLERLEEGRGLPLSLVSAPAGYGKTTLVSQWLERCDVPSAWVSLGREDSDLRLFLRYSIAAVRTLFPGACAEVNALLEADELPASHDLAVLLANELDGIGAPFVLALDDYHLVTEPEVHDLIDRVLEHPPRGLQLVILSRSDPPLSLSAMRARQAVIETRLAELSFHLEETAAYLERCLGSAGQEEAVARLHERTEGWPVGGRLVALAARGLGGAEELARTLDGQSAQLQDWLVGEILSRQEAGFRDALQKAAVLDRFSAPLCTAVFGPGAQGGEDFLRELERSGLPCVALDPDRKWFRYHHLLQDFLRYKLNAEMASGEVRELHARAAKWLEGANLVEESIEHTLLAGDLPGAARRVARSRRELASNEEWHRIRRLTAMLPRAAIETDPELILAEAWSGYALSPFGALDRQITCAEALLDDSSLDPELGRRLQGEAAALRAFERYERGLAREVVANATRALELLPEECLSERGFAVIMLAAGHQVGGDLQRARACVLELLELHSARGTTYHTRLLMALCFVSSFAGDLSNLASIAQAVLELGDELGLQESVQQAQFFLGLVHYHRGELAEARQHLAAAVADRRMASLHNYSQCMLALAASHLAAGDRAHATALVDDLLGIAARA